MKTKELTVQQYADLTGVTDRWIRMLCERGELPGAEKIEKFGSRWKIVVTEKWYKEQ